MSYLTKGIDRVELDYDWYTDLIEDMCSSLGNSGIEISTTMRGKRVERDVWFSGFSSQGDGLAFGGDISWPEFFEAYPGIKTKLTLWYMLLVANPDIVSASIVLGTGRHPSMKVGLIYTWWGDAVVEGGFFAGTLVENLPVVDQELEDFITEICENEASRMYQQLEEEYDYQLEDAKQRCIDDIIEENCEALRHILRNLPEEFDREQYIEDDEIDFDDLKALELVEYRKGGRFKLSAKAEEVMNETPR